MNLKEHLRARGNYRRAMAFLLAAVLTVGLLPVGPLRARAADWMQPYLDQLVEWGVMRGDITGNLHPERSVTRAEFVTMVNRAYGYDQMGENPFTDVDDRDWYADDIRIAYKTGYFAGTSATTASPEANLTREQAAVLLGRNMLMRSGVGEVLNFSDGREINDWARGMVREVANAGVIGGYEDGSFQPQKKITRGEMACMLVRAIGNLVQEPGEHTLGNVYGNVTITSSGVTLRDTVIAGDLYLTGGIGLGDVVLENVTVLGKIIASGGGESSKGESSIVLRNVTAEGMVVDSLSNQFVTIRAEGNTDIPTTSVRTSGYIEDATRGGAGLSYIELDAEPETVLQLAGNIKEVVNITPSSSLVMAEGTAKKITIDERAVGSILTIEDNAVVRELNLDVGTEVGGAGDIDHVNVNAPGSSIDILPDTITIRPGVDADVDGETMDNVIAEEHSEDPRLLAGYPEVRSITPRGADGIFKTNKKGTVYWAITAQTDGPATAEELLTPPAYSAKILRNGTLVMDMSNTEKMVKLSGLTSDGTYYLAAMLVDSRGKESPVKTAMFKTPDDTVPNFAPGYPRLTEITNKDAQAIVMPTKSCKLYYALMPKGAAAPKPADFKANAVTGNLGYGSMDVTKNTTTIIDKVNREDLKELETYDLYFWLTDHDGMKSSAVKKITFTTVDKTRPELQHIDVTDVKATSVELTYAINEPGTLYWAVVKAGETYPKPMNGQSGPPSPDSDAAKIQVENGMNALKSGKSNASKANTDVKFSVAGLKPQTAYDLYYFVRDKAGNSTVEVKKMPINTKDDKTPTVTQEFTSFNGDKKTEPLADTDIRLVFSEAVQGTEIIQGKLNTFPFMNLYQDVEDGVEGAEKALHDRLSQHISLYNVPAAGKPSPCSVDFGKTAITMEDGKMVLTIPNEALDLSSGATYYFHLSGIADTSTAVNVMGNTDMPKFTTVFAQLNITPANIDTVTTENGAFAADMSFQIDPMSTSSAEDSIYYGLMIWSDTSLEFDLYIREQKKDAGAWGAWSEPISFHYFLQENGSFVYQVLRPNDTGLGLDKLQALDEDTSYQYAIHVTNIGGSGERDAWNKVVNMKVTVAAGAFDGMKLVVDNNHTDATWKEAQKNGVISVGNPDPYTKKVPFSDSKAPAIVRPYPAFEVGDTIADMTFLLDREGTIYYVVTPVEEVEGNDGKLTISTPVPATIKGTGKVPLFKDVPTDGTDKLHPLELETPTKDVIINNKITDKRVRQGSVKGSAASTSTVHLTGLMPETTYYVYTMFQGTSSDVVSEYALCHKFTTEKIVRPVLDLSITGSSDVNITVDRTSDVYGKLMFDGTRMGKPFNDPFWTVGNIDPSMWQTDSPFKAGYTVLDAMIDSYSQARGSVFDHYASQRLKDEVAAIIRGKTNNPATTVDSFHKNPMEMNRTEIFSSTKMTPKTWYCFVAVANSPLGSGDAFRAVRPVQLVDGEKPLITSIGGGVDYNKKQNTLSGDITIVFSEILYVNVQYNGGQTHYPLALQKGQLFAPIEDTNGQKYWGYLGRITLPFGTFIREDALPTKVDRISLKLSNVKNGAQIILPAGLCDEWQNGADAGSCTITIRWDDATKTPVYTISPAWDGTKKK